MAIPVISAPEPLRIIAMGVPFSLQLAATESPTSWAASGLPSGVAIDVDTGLVSGTPTAAAQTTASMSATNNEGTSAPVTVVFVVMSRPPGAGGPFDLLLDYEVGDGKNLVSIPGVEPPAPGQPMFVAPSGTNRYLLVGIKQFGVLQDINPNAEEVTIALAMKELEPERLIELTMGPTEKVSAMPDDLQRYRIPFRITPAGWAGPLGDYETDGGTRLLALAELQVQVGNAASLHDDELTDTGIALQGGISSGTTGDHDFSGIPQFPEATRMRLTLRLEVAARPLQTVELVREFDLVYESGAYHVSNESGPTSGQGAAEGGQWRATLLLTALAGDAGGVDVDYEVTTTEDATSPRYVWILDLSGMISGGDLEDPGDSISLLHEYHLTLWDGGTPTQIGATETLQDYYGSPQDLCDAVAEAWETMSGTTDIHLVSVESASSLRIEALASTAVRKMGWDSIDPPILPLIDPTTTPGTTGTPRTASVTATLEQLESPSALPLNLTSRQFLVEIARDLAPD